MPRILGLVLFLLIAAIAFGAISGGGRRGQPGTYRPKPRWQDIIDEIRGRPASPTQRPSSAPAAPAGLAHVVKRSALVGVRDAFSSAPLDPDRPLARCGACLSFYAEDSRAALVHENNGRCVVCGGTDIGRVSLVDDE